MEENTNQVQEQTAVETEGKTFSQEDVNRIVGERLAKEKAKNESDWQQREQDLQKRELRMTAKEYLNEKNIPVELLNALNYTDEETLQKSVEIIEKFVEEKKKEVPPIKFVGVEPVEGLPFSHSMSNNNSIFGEDYGLRQAMKLP